MLAEFMTRAAGTVDGACFAVAGPVIGNTAKVTNLGWTMDAEALAAAFSIARVSLINDFYAVALGVPLLRPADLFSLNAGTRVPSGMALVTIHNFLAGVDRPYDERIPLELAQLAEQGDETATHAFEIFVDIYGAEAGNMALRTLARGGVFLAGGIAGKNVAHFTDGRFMRAFTRKGRYTALLQDIPIDLIVNAKVGLLGAVEAALRLVESH